MRRTTRSAGGDCALQQCGAGLGAAHAERVPVILDGEAALGIFRAWHERVDQLRRVGRGGVETMQPELRPDRREGGEDLRARERVRAIGPGCGIRVAAGQHQIVACLADAEREDLARHGARLHEAQVVDPAVGEHFRDARPHQVHVDRECSGGRGTGQALLQHGRVGEREPGAAEFLRNEDREIAGGRQLGEVLLGERVLAVVDRRPLAEAREQIVGKDAGRVEVAHPAILPSPCHDKRNAARRAPMSRPWVLIGGCRAACLSRR